MPAFMKMVKTVKIRTYRNSWSLNAGLGMLDSGFWTQDSGLKNAGHWTLDADPGR